MDRISPIATMSGFNLLELLIVITIVAILAAIGVPSFKYVTASNRIATEVNSLLGDMRYARAEAIKEGSFVTVCAAAVTGPTTTPSCSGTSDWSIGWIVFQDGTPPMQQYAMATEQLLRIQPSFGTTWNSTDTFQAGNSVSAVTFNREGFAVAYAGASSVTSATGTAIALHSTPERTAWTRCLDISAMGMIQTAVYSSAAAAAPWPACT